VEAHPRRPGLLGLRNLSSHPWTLVLSGGDTVTVAPGETGNLATVTQLCGAAGRVLIQA